VHLAVAVATFSQLLQGSAAISAGDWLLATASFLVGALTVAASLFIAKWQQSAGERNRMNQQRRMELRSQVEASRQEVLDRQESWRREYEEIRELLNDLSDRVHDVWSRGPVDSDALQSAGFDRLERLAEQLADRGPASLSDPLLRVGRAVHQLRETGLPSDADVLAEYRRAAAFGSDHLILREMAELAPHPLCCQAIAQYKAAETLSGVVTKCREVLRAEWFGGPPRSQASPG
jgi:hypothetical protein